MLKVFLLSCNVTEQPYPVYPLGMAMLADFLRKEGHEVLEADLLYENSDISIITGQLKEFGPEVIGLSLRNIDNINFTGQETYYRHYKNIAEAVKNIFPAVPLILGGSGFSLFPDELMALTGADYGIAGEGEDIFSKFLKDFERGLLPESKILRSEKLCVNFFSKSRNEKISNFYLKEGGMLNLQTKRGCNGRCIYCNYPALEGTSFRFRPVSDLVEEIKYLIRTHNADYLFFTDSVFNDSEGKYLQLAEEIIRCGIKIPWMAFFRPTRFNDGEVELLKRAGLSAVEWGTDAASDMTLAGLKKGFRWAAVAMANEMFSKAGIACSHFIIFGGPGETGESVSEGLANIARLERCVVFATMGLRIYPGTLLHKKALEDGVIKENTDLLEPVFYFSPEVKPDFIKDTVTHDWESRNDRIFTWDRKNIEIARSCHRMGFRGPAWDLILK